MIWLTDCLVCLPAHHLSNQSLIEIGRLSSSFSLSSSLAPRSSRCPSVGAFRHHLRHRLARQIRLLYINVCRQHDHSLQYVGHADPGLPSVTSGTSVSAAEGANVSVPSPFCSAVPGPNMCVPLQRRCGISSVQCNLGPNSRRRGF